MLSIIRSSINSSVNYSFKGLETHFELFLQEISKKLEISEEQLKNAVEESLPILKDGFKPKLSKEEIKKQKRREFQNAAMGDFDVADSGTKGGAKGAVDTKNPLLGGKG